MEFGILFMFFFLVKKKMCNPFRLWSVQTYKTAWEEKLWQSCHFDVDSLHFLHRYLLHSTHTVKTFVKEILKGFLNLPFKRFFRRNPWKRVVAVIWTGVWQKHGWLFPYIVKSIVGPYLFSANVLARRILIIFFSFLLLSNTNFIEVINISNFFLMLFNELPEHSAEDEDDKKSA